MPGAIGMPRGRSDWVSTPCRWHYGFALVTKGLFGAHDPTTNFVQRAFSPCDIKGFELCAAIVQIFERCAARFPRWIFGAHPAICDVN